MEGKYKYSNNLLICLCNQRCYHDDLQNLSVSEIRSVYANISRPSCTLLQGVHNGTGIVAGSGQCQDWIFKREKGYESLTTEVPQSNLILIISY